MEGRNIEIVEVHVVISVLKASKQFYNYPLSEWFLSLFLFLPTLQLPV